MYRIAIGAISFVLALLFFAVVAREARRRGWESFDVEDDAPAPEDDPRR